MTQTLHIHLGPHKTGSTAIQRSLFESADSLSDQTSLSFVHRPELAKAARALNRGDTSGASALLRECVSQVGIASNLLLSCEDLSGDLPGTTGKRRPYHQLWTNINVISQAFCEYECRFYFFLRDRDEWLKSAYVQNLKYRQKFRSFGDFNSFLRVEDLWDDVILKSKKKLGEKLILIPYLEDPGFSSVQALLTSLGQSDSIIPFDVTAARHNASPSTTVISIMEQINSSGASNEAKRNAKKKAAEPRQRA